MPEIMRSRDCILFVKDDAVSVAVSSAMVASGWPGGQGVQWVDGGLEPLVTTYARGRSAGMLLWGSDEAGDDFASTTRNQPAWRFATMIIGASLLSTSTYERYTIASRLAGPLVPLIYTENDPLYFSLRGYWTNEDELTVTADAAAPATLAGYVAHVPMTVNRQFLGIQTSL